MKRLTSDSPKGNFGNILNLFYVRDQAAWVRGGGSAPAYEDVSLYDFARQIISVHIPNADTVVSDDILDEIMAEWLLDGPETKEGLIALLYNAAWAFAELRERLSAYEDTGMEPEDVRRLQKDWTSLIMTIDEMGGMPHLHDISVAEKDGRLVVLPCKAGDTVYMPIGRYGITGYEEDVCDGFHIARDGVVQIKARCWSGNHGTYGIPGETAFLTRSEAEAALEGGDE